MIHKSKIDKKYIRYGTYILILAVALLISYKIISNGEHILFSIKEIIKNFFDIISPIFYGFVLAYLMYRPVVFFQNKLTCLYEKVSKKTATDSVRKGFRMLSIVIMLAIIIGTIALIIDFILPPIIENIKILLNNLPQYQDQIIKWVEEGTKKLSENNIDINSTGHLANNIVDKVSLLSNKALDIITSSITGISSFVLDLVLTIIFTFYFLKDKEALFNNFRRFKNVFLPKKVGNILTVFVNDLDEMVGKFLVAEILDSIIVGIVSTALLLIIKNPFAILIGCIAGVTNIIPYVGPIIGAVLAFISGIFTSFGLGVSGAVLLLLYQQVDGNFVQPKIVGDKIGLTPVWILIAVLIGGSYFGAMGMILSMPIAGLVRIYFLRYEDYKAKKELQGKEK